MPCASDPDRSASSIAPAVTAASEAGSPQAENASVMNDWIAAAGTRESTSALVICSSFFPSGWAAAALRDQASALRDRDLERELVHAFVTLRGDDEGVAEEDSEQPVRGD